MKTIIIGMGNPLLTDDGVGIKVVRKLRDRLKRNLNVDVTELYTGGLELMETMIGYEKAIIVDALISGINKPGTISSFFFDEEETGCHAVSRSEYAYSTHNTTFSAALKVGKLLRFPLPSEVKIWAVEANDVETFSEELTEPVAHAHTRVIDEILCYLEKQPGEAYENRSLFL